MNKLTTALATLTLTSIIASQATLAEETFQPNSLKQATKFSAGAIIGSLAGGPLGMVVGALAGGLIGERDSQKTYELQQANIKTQQLQQAVEAQTLAINKLEEDLAESLEFDVMFDTGKDAINASDELRIEILAEYLRENSQLNIRLDGHTDPRGTDEYNNILSHERAKNVSQRLEELGVNRSRIKLYSHGSSQTFKNTVQSYDFSIDRRVDIELFRQEKNNNFATTEF